MSAYGQYKYRRKIVSSLHYKNNQCFAADNKWKKGMLACGYVKVETADKLGDVLAIVTGVNSYDDMRLKPVVAVSKAAEALGIKPGMSGGQALAILA